MIKYFSTYYYNVKGFFVFILHKGENTYMKSKTTFICSECGYQTAKWLGKCPGCNGWNTLVETIVADKKDALLSNREQRKPSQVSKIKEITTTQEERIKTGSKELDRVLGGGLVKGSLILVGGDPGIGKSTLLLQICQSVNKKVLYISGEESERQIKIRAERLGVSSEDIYVVSETDVEAVIECILSIKPDIVIIDSIQTMTMDLISSAAGSVPQVREATNAFMKIAKNENIAMFIVGHVTKDGAIAGPRVLEHMVDCVLYFEGDRQLSFRILRSVKNRFGSTNEIGVFDMKNEGLVEVENPSAALLEGRNSQCSGSSIVCCLEGTRGVLAEVQALVTATGFGNPRRMSSGIDLNRVILMTAVLEKRANIQLSASDIYINVAGGLKIDETAVDLGLCAAIASSLKDFVIPPHYVFIGEVGLGGELRAVSNIEKRISEANKLGFKTAIVPKQLTKGLKTPAGFEVIGMASLSDVIKFLKN